MTAEVAGSSPAGGKRRGGARAPTAFSGLALLEVPRMSSIWPTAVGCRPSFWPVSPFAPWSVARTA
jgi:hypothetical protein